MVCPDTFVRIGLVIAALNQVLPTQARRTQAPEKPQFLRLKPSDVYLRLTYEDEEEELVLARAQSGQIVREESLEPAVGLTLGGSIYHSKLLQYNVVTENGYRDGKRLFDAGDNVDRASEQQDFELNRVHATVNLLREKPYRTTLFYLRGRDRREYDRFRSFTTDQEKAGVQLNYQNGIAPWSLRLTHFDETVDDTDRPSRRVEDTGRVRIVHERRARDKTRLNYTVNAFDQQDGSFRDYQGTSHTVQFSDRQYHGVDDRVHAFTHVRYNDLDTDLSRNRDLSFRHTLTVQHRASWKSRAQYLYSDRDTGERRVGSNHLDLSLEHQLFDSLESTLGFEGLYADARGTRAGSDGYRVGPYLHEHYTKQLGESARLLLRSEGQWYEEQRNRISNAAGARQEAFTLSASRARFLRAP